MLSMGAVMLLRWLTKQATLSSASSDQPEEDVLFDDDDDVVEVVPLTDPRAKAAIAVLDDDAKEGLRRSISAKSHTLEEEWGILAMLGLDQ